MLAIAKVSVLYCTLLAMLDPYGKLSKHGLEAEILNHFLKTIKVTDKRVIWHLSSNDWRSSFIAGQLGVS